MKKIIILVVLFTLTVTGPPASAALHDGLMYMQWPYAWSYTHEDWLYFHAENDNLWIYNYDAGRWYLMGHEDTVELTATEDAYVSSTEGSQNFGNWGYLFTGQVPFHGADYTYYSSYIRFDLSGIPRGAEIVAADLTLTTYPRPFEYTATINVSVPTACPGGDWSELTLTWANQPTGSIGIDSVTGVTFNLGSNEYTFDVAEAVDAVVNDGATNWGFRIGAGSISSGTEYCPFTSREGLRNGPRLTVTYR